VTVRNKDEETDLDTVGETALNNEFTQVAEKNPQVPMNIFRKQKWQKGGGRRESRSRKA